MLNLDHGAVDDWSGWADPTELQASLDVLLVENAELRGEIAQLRADNARLRTDLGLPAETNHVALPPASQTPSSELGCTGAGTGLPYVDAGSDTAAKIALFRELFVGRDDVYARRWVSAKSGRTGWSPAEDNPFEKNKDEAKRVFWPLTDQVLYQHLSQHEPGRREVHLGLYPLLADDSCRLLVCDFDGKDGSDWRGDTSAYVAACRDVGVPVITELSRSGHGAHVWTFFTDRVAAASARALGMALLRKAIDTRGHLTLSSYDRFFPAQDFVPSKANGNARLGNVIALPLHGACRSQETTVFCDPETWTPYPDQFASLSSTERLSAARVDVLVDTLGQVTAGPSATAPVLPAKPRRTALGQAPATVQARLSAMLALSTDELPPQLLAALKHTASLHNPDFYRKQNQRFSTWNTPRFVCCFDDAEAHWLQLPRGLLDEALQLIQAAGGTVEVTHEFPEHAPIAVRCTAELTAVQTEAVTAMTQHPTGVLVAPPGSGKTVMACALIAHHARPTAVIVNRAELLAQWRQRLATFLHLGDGPVGSLGGGKDRRGHLVDLIMLQTLTHRDAPDDLLDGYGLVIVDECHAVGAPAAEAAIRKATVLRWVGLSATPYRADQMDALITMQCGPIRHKIDDASAVPQHLLVHTTQFTTDEPSNDGPSIQALYNELAHDPQRNAQIAGDIADAARRGRCSLALTNRVEHLHQLAEALKSHGVAPLILHGGMPPADRSRVRAALADEHAGPLVLLAMDKLAGEGFDAPQLDTLFLVSPISFKGRVIQQVGRIMRNTEETKSHVEAHDYLDAKVPQLERMHHKRRRILKQRGFTTTPPPRALDSAETPARATTVPTDPHTAAQAPTTTPPVPQVRTWARNHGFDVSARGRLPVQVWNAYHAAHPHSASHNNPTGPEKADTT